MRVAHHLQGPGQEPLAALVTWGPRGGNSFLSSILKNLNAQLIDLLHVTAQSGALLSNVYPR